MVADISYSQKNRAEIASGLIKCRDQVSGLSSCAAALPSLPIFAPTQLRDGLLTSQTIQDDADLLFG